MRTLSQKFALLVNEQHRLAILLERHRTTGKICCYHCGASSLVYVGSFHDKGCKHTLWLCNVCEIVQLGDRLPEQTVEELEDQNEIYQDEPTSLVEIRIMENSFIVNLLNTHHKVTGKLLEVGCSRGYKLEAARRAGWIVAGIELSSVSCSFAQNVLGLDVHRGTLETFYADDCFDAVIAWHVLEHVPSIGLFLDHVKTLLNIGGHFFVQVPSYERYRELPEWYEWRENFCAVHYWYFTSRSLCQALKFHQLSPVYVFDDERTKHLTVVAMKIR